MKQITPFPVLRRHIKRFFSPPRCLEIDRFDPPADAQLFIRSNGLNLSSGRQPIYVIRQNGAGRGLFSLVSSIVCHLHLAERFKLLPFVDLGEGRTEYQDKEYVGIDPLGRANPWTFYFKPISTLDQLEPGDERTVLASNLGFPSGYPAKMLISHHQALRDITERYIQPSVEMEEKILLAQQNVFQGSKVLGVHIRGQEQKTMPYHPLSPTLDQIYTAIERAISDYGFDQIFVASEDLDYVEALMDRFPGKAVTLPHFRTRSPVNAYRIYPRPQHKYLLGQEILIDAFLLSSCQGMVSSTSNVTEFARAKNNGSFLLDLVIDNGLNATNPLLAKHVWGWKSFLPPSFGGFSTNAIQPFPSLTNSSQGGVR